MIHTQRIPDPHRTVLLALTLSIMKCSTALHASSQRRGKLETPPIPGLSVREGLQHIRIPIRTNWSAEPPQLQQIGLWPSCPLAAPAWPAHPHRAPNKWRGSGGGRGGGGGGEGALYPIPTATGTFPPLGSLSTLSQQTPPPRLWPGVQLAGAGKPSQTARGQQRSGRASLLPGIPPATGVRSRYSKAPPLPSTPLLLDPALSLSHPPARPALL